MDTVAIVLVVAVVVGAFFVSQSNRETPRLRIAIMPFEASISEWIVAELAAIGGDSVGVVGPTTTAVYGDLTPTSGDWLPIIGSTTSSTRVTSEPIVAPACSPS